MAEGTMRLGLALNGYGLTIEPGHEREVLPWHELLLIAETAEETGYDILFTPEIRAREAFATLAGFASATTQMNLASGVVPIASRDPVRMAMGAATMQDLSDGRFVLGLGSQGPLEHTRHYLQAIRELLGGGVAAVAGADGAEEQAVLDLPRPEELGLPIYLAALGPRMTELGGEVADGVILNWCTPERVSQARGQVAAGAERAGGDPARRTVAVYVRACLGHEERHALSALREACGQYAAMEKYRRQFEAMGLGPQAAAAARAWEAGSLDAVPEDLLRAVCVWGPREDAIRRLREYTSAGADLVVVYPVPAQEAASSIMGTVLAAAPDPSVEA
jgi:alkanesulfonate monooxygenase SsuD/methylene tetrahydromethanopterin reductase-like flavin-dependent oxidoreductase (luciferase family)